MKRKRGRYKLDDAGEMQAEGIEKPEGMSAKEKRFLAYVDTLVKEFAEYRAWILRDALKLGRWKGAQLTETDSSILQTVAAHMTVLEALAKAGERARMNRG